MGRGRGWEEVGEGEEKLKTGYSNLSKKVLRVLSGIVEAELGLTQGSIGLSLLHK